MTAQAKPVNMSGPQRSVPAGFRPSRGGRADGVPARPQMPGDVMIGPPGLPKHGRRVFSFARVRRKPIARRRLHAWRWLAGLYMCGVLAHFSHNLAFDLSRGANSSVVDALASAPVSLVWPADLIGTLI